MRRLVIRAEDLELAVGGDPEAEDLELAVGGDPEAEDLELE